MSLTKMIIPKTINVGFNKREDTYTKKLAYIIYTDAKGVLRKETSWEGWRDKSIPAQAFDNVPTSGFVLNKKVGGNRYSWNPRNTYVRIYDPRDFEFEITVPNLLFILQETNSIKGKGLEGEFVYAWDGKDLVLLPVGCEEYNSCADFTHKQTTKVDRSEIKEGSVYQMKDLREVMYLGKHEWAEEHGWGIYRDYYPVGKRHIFIDLNYKKPLYSEENPYIAMTGYAKLSNKISDNNPSFADEYTKFLSNIRNRGSGKIELRKVSPNFMKGDNKNGYPEHHLLQKEGEAFRPVNIRITYVEKQKFICEKGDLIMSYQLNLEETELARPFFYRNKESQSTYGSRYSWYSDRNEVDLSSLEKQEFYTVIMHTNRGEIDLLKRGFKRH